MRGPQWRRAVSTSASGMSQASHGWDPTARGTFAGHRLRRRAIVGIGSNNGRPASGRVVPGEVGPVTVELIAPTAASRRIADYLRAEILAGVIGPGQWIRQEEVAQRLRAPPPP